MRQTLRIKRIQKIKNKNKIKEVTTKKADKQNV